MCKQAETREGTTTVFLERDSLMVVMKGAPDQICENCAEPYTDEIPATRVFELARSAEGRGAELEILRFAA